MKKFFTSLLLILPLFLKAEPWDDQVFDLENTPPPFFPFSTSGSYINVANTRFRTPGFRDQHLKYGQWEAAYAYTHPFNSTCGLIFGAGWIGTEVKMQDNPDFDATLFNYVNLSFGGFTKAFPDWIWTATVAAYLDTTEFSLIDYTLYQGVLWGKYSMCKQIELDFGFILEAGLNKGKIWPIFGFIYIPCERFRINAIYPINICIEYDIWESLSAAGSIRFLRNRHRVGDFEPNPQSIFEYRTAGAEFDLTYRPWARLMMKGFIGSTFNGDFKISNRNDKHATHYKFKGSLYGGASAVLSF